MPPKAPQRKKGVQEGGGGCIAGLGCSGNQTSVNATATAFSVENPLLHKQVAVNERTPNANLHKQANILPKTIQLLETELPKSSNLKTANQFESYKSKRAEISKAKELLKKTLEEIQKRSQKAAGTGLRRSRRQLRNQKNQRKTRKTT